MQDKTINNALLALYKQTKHGKHDGVEHITALMELRGVSVPTVYTPRMFRSRQLKAHILEAIRDSPKSLNEIVDHVHTHRASDGRERCYNSTSTALTKYKLRGLVVNEGGVWAIKPPSANTL